MVINIILEWVFWCCIVLIIYAYVGYPVFIWMIARLSSRKPHKAANNFEHPTVTLFVAAFNEQDFVDQKVENSKQLKYPKEKLEMVWVTDGSNDKTNELLAKYPEIKVYFEPERRGKIHAMKRGMELVNSEIIIFTDANTLLASQSIEEIVKIFCNPDVGCVAGEKRILHSNKEDAASAGEGFYWKYESWVKLQDSKVGSTIGAAGELFAFRKELYQPVNDDAILDDFEISLKIALKGFKIGYAPEAYALEKPSANVHEEMKRKVRIAAGSIQAMVRLLALFNFFKHPVLSFQYISHKVLRWVAVPLALAILIPVNIAIVVLLPSSDSLFYSIALIGQIAFYLFVIIGRLMRDKKLGAGIIFVPYYFYLANWAMWLGFFRYCRKQQSVNWERAKRAN